MSDVYIDPWQDYKTITTKLKKTFFGRKPNIGEGTFQYSQLAARLQEEQCFNYAGLCQVAVARNEGGSKNFVGELRGLIQAARHYCDAESDKRSLLLPGFEENLSAAIHCYGHAIRLCADSKQPEMGASLCMELATFLYSHGKTAEALDFFKRAASMFASDPMSRINASKWTTVSLAEIGDYFAALSEVCSLALLITELFDEPFGAFRETLADCEVLAVFLLLQLSPLPHHLTSDQRILLQRYTFPSFAISSSQDPAVSSSYWSTSFLEENQQMCLQSFVMAIQSKDHTIAEELLDEIWQFTHSYQQSIVLHLIESISKS